MSDMNQCNFTGRFWENPQSTYTPSGTAVCNFSLPINSRKKDKATGENKDDTQWVNFVAFGKTAEIICQYMTKGSYCRITGRMQNRKWQDKEGKDRYKTEIIVDEFQMLGGKKQECAEPAGGGDHAAGDDGFSDDIPF